MKNSNDSFSQLWSSALGMYQHLEHTISKFRAEIKAPTTQSHYLQIHNMNLEFKIPRWIIFLYFKFKLQHYIYSEIR
jgi:hypothetical protein